MACRSQCQGFCALRKRMPHVVADEDGRRTEKTGERCSPKPEDVRYEPHEQSRSWQKQICFLKRLCQMSPGGAVSAPGGRRAAGSAGKAARLWHLSTGVFGRTGGNCQHRLGSSQRGIWTFMGRPGNTRRRAGCPCQ